ncbi:MAG: M23 family metallopeptidase [Bacteroidales bacterium]|nr:M23 family metallopeptidase [Bacteroidales bacterium]
MAKNKKESKEYRLIVYDDNNLRELTSFKITTVNIIAYTGLAVIVIAVIVGVLFVYTPINSMLPRTSEKRFRNELESMAFRIDSLESVIVDRETYFKVVSDVLSSNIDTENSQDSTEIERQKIDFARNKHDSILRTLIEEEEKRTLAAISGSDRENNLKKMMFFMPAKGTLVAKFDVSARHFGIDIATKGDEPVLATLPGTVVSASWNVETGNVIQIQHDNNLISIYKHCSVMHKKVGDKVEAGEPIAIVGNSGEYTSGPHLHFELWHDRVPVNPELYIPF